MAIMVSPLSSRNRFGEFLNERYLVGVGVEVGTHRGEFANALLHDWKGALHCVDPWRDNLEGYALQEKILKEHLGGSETRMGDFKAARILLDKYGERVYYQAMTSIRACRLFTDESLDFVYVDGNHEPPHPEQDLKRWYPKLKVGGVLAIHDVVCPGPDPSWGRYIFPALYEFATAEALDLYLIVEEGGLPWSGYVIKE